MLVGDSTELGILNLCTFLMKQINSFKIISKPSQP